jgi:hypothetical protein
LSACLFLPDRSGMTGGCANWPSGVNLSHCMIPSTPPIPASTTFPSPAPLPTDDPLQDCSPVEICADASVLMCLHIEEELYTECVPITLIQAALDGNELNTCGACDVPPTPSPTIGFSCEGQRCAGNDYVFVCHDGMTLCLDQEAAGILLLSDQASCGRCGVFGCDLANFGCSNNKVEICHM